MNDVVKTVHQRMKPTDLVVGDVRCALGDCAGACVLASIRSRNSGLLRDKYKLKALKLRFPTRFSHSEYYWSSGGTWHWFRPTAAYVGE